MVPSHSLKATNRIRILLADPSSMSRGLISQGLEHRHEFNLIASVGRSDELLKKLGEVSHSPDIALISVSLEDGPMAGLSVLSQIHDTYPQIRLIVLMDRSAADVVAQAFHSGARGVFARTESDFAALCKCIRSVHEGQIWASTQHIEFLINALRQTPRLRVVNSAGLQLLSKREEDVVRLVAESMSNREISEKLNLSEHTVKNYLFRIFDKLGVSSRTELVLYSVSCAKDHLPLLEPDSVEKEADPAPIPLRKAMAE